MSKNTGIYRVRWWSSAAAARFLEHLECKGEATPERLARECHAQRKYALSLLRVLKRAGVIRIVAWRHNISGTPTPIYRLGPGLNLPMPTPETVAQRSSRRRKSLVALHGPRAADIILKKSRGRIVIDGRIARPGDHDSQIAGMVSR